MINVLVAGFKGSMGNKTIHMVANNDKFKLAGVYNPVVTEKNVNEVAEFAD